MAYLNKVMLIGNLGKDPEIRVTTSGNKKVSFSLATSRKYKGLDGSPTTKRIGITWLAGVKLPNSWSNFT